MDCTIVEWQVIFDVLVCREQYIDPFRTLQMLVWQPADCIERKEAKVAPIGADVCRTAGVAKIGSTCVGSIHSTPIGQSNKCLCQNRYSGWGIVHLVFEGKSQLAQQR